MRTISCEISSMILGRPGPRRWAQFHFSATNRRCHRSRVSGETIVSSSDNALRPTAFAFRTRSARSSSVNRSRLPLSFSFQQPIRGLQELDDRQLMPVNPARDNHQ